MAEWVITKEMGVSFDADLKEPGTDGVWRSAWVKWDGCVQYMRYFNAPRGAVGRDPDDTDNIHLCSVAETVAELIDLLRLAQSKLGGEWNGEASDLDKLLADRGWKR